MGEPSPSQPSREVDVRRLPATAVLDAFGSLAAGEHLTLWAQADPREVVAALQRAHPRGFDWSVLERGQDGVRVSLRRRDSDSPRSVTEYLSFDHARLDGLMREAVELALAGRMVEALRACAELRCGIERHTRMEEEVLFTFLQRATGLPPGGLTSVICHEHGRVREGLAEAAMALEQGDVAGFQALVAAVTRVLSVHHHKEERILYPAADAACESPEERERLVQAMQRL